MSPGLQNIMRREAARQGGEKAHPKCGTVSAYDPTRYAAKVIVQPDGYETGFIPIGSEWVGSGWGLYAPPTPGDEVEINYQEGGKNAPYIGKRYYGDNAPPLPVPSGEFWLVHKSGSFLKFKNDGSVAVTTAGDLDATVGGQANLTVTGKVVASAAEFDLTGNLKVTGTITATGDIYDRNGANDSVQNIRHVYDIHTHVAPDGLTSTPTPQLED